MKKTLILIAFTLLLSIKSFSSDFWERVDVPNDTPVSSVNFSKSGNIYCSSFNNISFSNDSGNTWYKETKLKVQNQFYNFSFLFGSISSIASVNDSIILVATNDFLARSTDGGKIWELNAKKYSNISNIVVSNSGRCFAYSSGSLLISDDLGINWNNFKSFDSIKSGNSNVSFLKIIDDKKLIAIKNGLWIIDINNLSNYKYVPSVDTFKISYFDCKSNNILIYTKQNDFYFSNDTGSTFSKLSNIPNATNITKVFLSENNTLIAGSNQGGLYISNDLGKTWQSKKNNNSVFHIYDINSFKNKIYIASDNLYSSIDSGNSWQKIPNSPSYPIVFDADLDNQTYLYINTGSTFYKIDPIDINYGVENLSKFDTNFTNNSNYMMIDYNSNLYTINNEGKFLIKTYNNIISENIFFNKCKVNNYFKNNSGDIYTFYSDSSYRNYLAVSTDNGIIWKNIKNTGFFGSAGIGSKDEIILVGDSIHISTNNGSTWNVIEFKDKDSKQLLNGIMGVYIDNKNIFLLGRFNGVLFSSDLGENWKIVNDGIFKNDYNYFSVKLLNGKYYLCCSSGVYTSDTNNIYWSLLDTSGKVNSINFGLKYAINKHLYSSTSTGLYRTKDQILSVENGTIDLDNFNFSIFPNPSNKNSVLKLCSKDFISNIKLSLYDLKGTLIGNLFDGTLNNEIEIKLNSLNLISSSYFIRAEYGSNSKLLQIKIEN